MNTKSICRCAMFSALIAIGAYIKIPLPLCPVTMQVMFVVLSGLLLNKKLAALSCIIYAVTGLIGIPVFSQGGGIGYIMNPTFGYIIGFIFGAFITSLIASGSLSLKRLLIGSYSGMAVIYAVGAGYFYIICNYITDAPVGISAVLVSCVLLTLPIDIISCFFAAVLSRRIKRQMKVES